MAKNPIIEERRAYIRRGLARAVQQEPFNARELMMTLHGARVLIPVHSYCRH